MRILFSASMLLTLMLVCFLSTSTAADEKKTVTMKGKVIRSDNKAPVNDALLILLDDKKSDKQDNSVEARTDQEGNYVFEKVVPGKYTVSIRAWYPTQEAAPCQLLMAKTSDKNSVVTIMVDKDKFVQQVFIKGFSVGNKDFAKDFDFACKSIFAN